jgi:hypothetical protein
VGGILIQQAPRQTTTFGFDDPPPIPLYQLATDLGREPTARPRSEMMKVARWH